MIPDPQERFSDSERTYQAFDSTDVRPPEDRSLLTPPETEEPTRTRRSGSGSGPGFRGDWDDEDAIPTDADGKLFGKYRIIRKLGAGGMGSVWLVEHVRFEQQRALKIIKSDVAESETNRLRFEQEAKILARLSRHPNAVTVYDTDLAGKYAYIEMDYLEGWTLKQRLEQNGPMPVHDVLWILGELCAVLGEAHRQKIVHRDIKPQNIMIVPDPAAPRGERVKVLDFGIAKIVRDVAAETHASLTQDSIGVLGTIPYSSPEQLGVLETGQTQSVVDYRSDIYSLGVMLYEMLVGARPFTGTHTKILYDHAHSPPPRFAELAPKVGVPSAVEEVVRRCLEKGPARRPQSAPELLASFGAAVGVEPPPKPEQPPTPTLRERLGTLLLRRRRALLGGLITAAILGGVLAAITLRPVPPPRQPIRDWLQAKGFEPDLKGGLGHGGWPRRIQEISGVPRRRMVLDGKYYLPEGFKPDPSAGTSQTTGLPNALDREGTRFILLEGGEFCMGDFNEVRPEGEKPQFFYPDEQKGHSMTLSSFYMQRTEVSNGEFDRFCRDTKRQPSDPEVKSFFKAWRDLADNAEADPEIRQNYPATGVSHRMAREYARWIGGDLPTEAQWEFAARSRGKPQLFVWGNDVERLKAVINAANVGGGREGPFKVDFAKNQDKTEQGIYHLAGNVREWCRDAWGVYSSDPQKDYVKEPDRGDRDPDYVIRGGSYMTLSETARTTWRSGEGSRGSAYTMKDDQSEEDLGFRVVLEILECQPDLGAQPRATASREARP